MKHSAVAALAGFLLFPAAAQAQSPRVAVEQGVLAGRTQDGVTAFKGIPFAAPPVGDLRWRAPQTPSAWVGPRDAANFGHDCMQVYQANPMQRWLGKTGQWAKWIFCLKGAMVGARQEQR